MQKVHLKSFKGLWSRDPVESCPPDHFTDCLNNGFNSGAVTSRYGTSLLVDFGLSIMRVIPFIGNDKNDANGIRQFSRPTVVTGPVGTWKDWFKYQGSSSPYVTPVNTIGPNSGTPFGAGNGTYTYRWAFCTAISGVAPGIVGIPSPQSNAGVIANAATDETRVTLPGATNPSAHPYIALFRSKNGGNHTLIWIFSSSSIGSTIIDSGQTPVVSAITAESFNSVDIGPGYSLISDMMSVSMFNRIYGNPMQNGVAYPGSGVNVYNGILPSLANSIYRTIAGASQSTAYSLASAVYDANSGLFKGLSNGLYGFAIAYETDTGFIRPPSNYFAYYANHVGINENKPTLNIGTGPAGTKARWLLGTKNLIGIANSLPTTSGYYTALNVAPFYNSTTEEPPRELFFAKRIPNNTDTTVAVMYADDDLSESADYLFSQAPAVPSFASIGVYNGRLVGYGADPTLGVGDRNTIWVSKSGEPESFDPSKSVLVIDPTDPSGVQAGVEFRGNLYIFTRNRTAVTRDNGDYASSWEVEIIDKSIGTVPRGIARTLDVEGSPAEGFMVASEKGIHFFNGAYQEPELTFKVENIWKRVNREYFWRVELHNDTVNKILYALIPLDAATVASHCLMGDYKEGLANMKWSLWHFGDNIQGGMMIYNNTHTSYGPLGISTVFAVGTKLLRLDSTVQQDAGVNISSNFSLAPQRFGDGLSQFNRIRMRHLGNGTLRITPYNQDLVSAYPTIDIALIATPGREYAYLFNVVNEECRLKFENVGNTKYEIRWIQIEGDFYGDERPR